MTQAKALIFGGGSQDGHYLSEQCGKANVEVISCSRRSLNFSCDVSDFKSVENLISKIKPDFIFNFAARSTTSHDALFENHQTISTGTLNILEATRLHRPEAKVFITGSAVQFLNKGQPISEIDPFEASSPYSIARIQSVYAARYYRSLGLRVYVGYLFHHESPLRGPGHVSMKIVNGVRAIKNGHKEKIKLGDLSVRKEWNFAGDITSAILTLLKQDQIFEAVIGSGQDHSIQDWLEVCFGLINERWQNHVTVEPGFVSEYQKLVSNPSVIRSLGWAPKISFNELADLMVNADSRRNNLS